MRRISRRSIRGIMDDERDRRAVIGGLRRVRDWFQAPALARYVTAETLPGRDVQSYDELLVYARRTGTTVFHVSCSCRMGPDATPVEDDQLRVRGVGGPRVIDASVMPAVRSTNTNAPMIMIAEKGAAMVIAAGRVGRGRGGGGGVIGLVWRRNGFRGLAEVFSGGPYLPP